MSRLPIQQLLEEGDMNIRVSRYPQPTAAEREAVEAEHPGCRFPSDDWEGYIEPEDGRWIIFVGTDGGLRIYTERGPSGAVVDASAVDVPPPA